MDNLVSRAIRAAMLDKNLYEEVEADQTAMLQAMIIVALAGVAAAVAQEGLFDIGHMVRNLLTFYFGWFLWAFITMWIGTNIMKGANTQADMGELLRTLGFASSPGIIRVVGIIPGFGWLSAMVASVWMLVAMVIAVRQALDYERIERAIIVCLIGFLPYMLVYWVVMRIF